VLLAGGIKADEYGDNKILQTQYGHQLDLFYYDAGNRVDRVRITGDDKKSLGGVGEIRILPQ